MVSHWGKGWRAVSEEETQVRGCCFNRGCGGFRGQNDWGQIAEVQGIAGQCARKTRNYEASRFLAQSLSLDFPEFQFPNLYKKVAFGGKPGVVFLLLTN